MGVESYNILLYPVGDEISLGEDGWEVTGNIMLNFKETQKIILSLKYVESYKPKSDWFESSEECHFFFNDGKSIIEIQINDGEVEEELIEIAVRFAVCNPDGTHEKAMNLCKELSQILKLSVLDMKLHKILNFNDATTIKESHEMFERKKKAFFEQFNLPYGIISEPIHCGRDVFERLEKGI